MAFCTVCGDKLPEGAKFCTTCGAKVEPLIEAQPAPEAQTAAPVTGVYTAAPETPEAPAPEAPQSGSYNAAPAPLPVPPAQPPQPDPASADASAPDPEDVTNNKVMAVLAYLGWLVLIPLFARRESPYARFHTNQGLILALIQLAIYIVRRIVVRTLELPIGWVFSILSLAVLVFAIIGIVNAVEGKTRELPLIGSLRILK